MTFRPSRMSCHRIRQVVGCRQGGPEKAKAQMGRGEAQKSPRLPEWQLPRERPGVTRVLSAHPREQTTQESSLRSRPGANQAAQRVGFIAQLYSSSFQARASQLRNRSQRRLRGVQA
jgi:hypothetical protein